MDGTYGYHMQRNQSSCAVYHILWVRALRHAGIHVYGQSIKLSMCVQIMLNQRHLSE